MIPIRKALARAVVKGIDRVIVWLQRHDRPPVVPPAPPPPPEKWGEYDGKEPEAPVDEEKTVGIRGIELLDVELFEAATRNAPGGGTGPGLLPSLQGVSDRDLPPWPHVALRMAHVPPSGNPTHLIAKGSLLCRVRKDVTGDLLIGEPVYRVTDDITLIYGGTALTSVEPFGDATYEGGPLCVGGATYIRCGSPQNDERDSLLVQRVYSAAKSGQLPPYINRVLFDMVTDSYEARNAFQSIEWDRGTNSEETMSVVHKVFNGKIALTFRGDRLTRASVVGFHAEVTVPVIHDFELTVNLTPGHGPHPAFVPVDFPSAARMKEVKAEVADIHDQMLDELSPIDEKD